MFVQFLEKNTFWPDKLFVLQTKMHDAISPFLFLHVLFFFLQILVTTIQINKK